MKKVNDLIILLKNYNKIVEITSGNQLFEINEVIEILKKYKNWSFDKLQQKLDDETSKLKPSKVSQRQVALNLGALYYQSKSIGGLSEAEQIMLSTYLALPENEILVAILNTPFEDTYKVINELSDKLLVINQLAFLGMALLNIKLKSGSKATQKRNLLDVLWKVIENQKMNEIYEGFL